MQNSGPWDPWLPVVENSRLFAQRTHSTGPAHGAPPRKHTPQVHTLSLELSHSACTARAQRTVRPLGNIHPKSTHSRWNLVLLEHPSMYAIKKPSATPDEMCSYTNCTSFGTTLQRFTSRTSASCCSYCKSFSAARGDHSDSLCFWWRNPRFQNPTQRQNRLSNVRLRLSTTKV